MMDRVPAYLEIEAAGMPFPCKIVLKPNARRYGYSEAVQNLVAQHVVIYVSTKTKNPSARNHQLMLSPPVKRVFTFAPVADGGGGGAKDTFRGKIYLCVSYDLTGGLEEADPESNEASRDNNETSG